MRANRKGFTLIELSFSFSLLTVFLLLVTTMLRRTQDNYTATMNALDLDTSGSAAVRRVRELLRGATLATITPQTPLPGAASRAEFQRDLDGDGTWSDVERIEWRLAPGELADGADNDGNGLVDDGQVVWIEAFGLPGQRDHVLTSGVPLAFRGELLNGLDDNGNGLIDEPGLFFGFVGDTLRIGLSLECSDPRIGRIGSSLETSVHLRN